MNKLKKAILALSVAMIAAVLCELLVFNFKAVTSIGAEWRDLPEAEFVGDPAKKGYILFRGVDAETGYVHVNLVITDAVNRPMQTAFEVYITDEGSSSFYRVGDVEYTQDHLKHSYFRINSYGKVGSIKLIPKTVGASYTVESAEINGSVPFFVSIPRMFALFALISLIYAVRPSSELHDNRVWRRIKWSRGVCAALILAVNVAVLSFLAGLNGAFVNIPQSVRWEHHQQYAKLARALTEGKTYIETPMEEETTLTYLAELSDPYDKDARNDVFESHDAVSPWDTAYYNGHLYVYFGVVPVLLMYLPHYLITGSDLSTNTAMIAAMALMLAAAYLFMRSLIRRYFPRTPFTVYLMLSLLLGNCTCAVCYCFEPSFYSLPICLSLAFVMFGLALWMSAADKLDAIHGSAPDPYVDADALCFGGRQAHAGYAGVCVRLAFGSLFMALTAGCRPQFLVFSFFCIPIFLRTLKAEKRASGAVRAFAAFALPYIAVAAGVMYYNAIRFGSPFDFGANYNLTTNNMPLRGWKLSRLPDGFFDYLFRLPSVSLKFPYVQAAPATGTYMGMSVRETMFGGAFAVNIFLWMIFLYRRARVRLKNKGLRGFAVLSAVLAVIVIAADTEMAGILWRYTGDFLLLLYIPAVMVFLALAERSGEKRRRRLIAFLIAAVVVTVAFDFFAGITYGLLDARSPENYNRLYALLG